MISSPPPDVHYVNQNQPVATVAVNVILVDKDTLQNTLWLSSTAPASTKGVLLGSVAGTGLFDQIANRKALDQQLGAPVFLTCSEMIRQLTKSISISVLAEILEVTRPTIYAWQDEVEPQKEKQSRIETVFQIFSTVDSAHLSLLSKVWNRKLSGSQSLYEILTSKSISETDFKNGMIAVEPLFQKLINRDLNNRKNVSELVAETPIENTDAIQKWDKLPAVGLEII